MDITLDPGIRVWIFAPIAFITFLFGLAMHYVRLLVASERKPVLVRCGTSGKKVDRKDFLPECNRKKIPHVFSTI